MRSWWSLLLLLFALPSLGQKAQHRSAWSDEQTSPRLLAQKITAQARTEGEKVDAIMQWISGNIGYNTGVLYTTPRKAPILYPAPPLEDTNVLPPLNDHVAVNVLRRRVAVCDGYARLFASLCFYAGVKAELVTGYVRPDRGQTSSRFRSNHTWNAVRIDSNWHLLDVTWASGYVTFGNQYVPHYNPGYYLASPRDFIRDHYPEDLRWTLLPEPPALAEFWDAPFRYQAFLKFNIQNFSPSSGVIEAAPGDTVRLRLASRFGTRNLVVTTEPISDALIDSLERSTAHKNNPENPFVNTSYVFKESDGEWLHVLFNNEPILRYRVVRPKRLTSITRDF